MTDPRTAKLADILVNYSTAVKPGDWVLISGGVLALPLLNEVLRQVARAGGRPTLLMNSDLTSETLLREAALEQLEWVSPIETLLYDQIDVLISVRASENTRALNGVDPQKQRAQQIARRSLMETYMRRSAEGSLRWVGTLFPTPAFAQDADMSLADYEDFVYRATYADQPDPVAKWTAVSQNQERLVNWLKGKRVVQVRGPHVDLSLSIEGRTFINGNGKNNMPCGEIFTGPVEDSVNGWVKFTHPAISGGREVDGVELQFQGGKVVSARARKNEEYLLKMLDSDAGARYLGEFAVGTNYGINRFTRSILFDEKIGGTIHMAVGSGYPETGSRNQSSIHWDMICDMRTESEILVDGELFYRNGEFQV